MFESIMRLSEAAAAHRLAEGETSVLRPALWTCQPCGAVAMIAAPVWGSCAGCGRAFADPPAGPSGQSAPKSR